MNETVLPEVGEARRQAGDAEVAKILRAHGIRARGLNKGIEQLPAGPEKDRAAAHRKAARAAGAAKLRELVAADDPRTRGGVNAIEVAELCREVELDDIKPGDLIQTWTKSGGGHSTMVANVQVRALVWEDGECFEDVVTLTKDTPPESIAMVKEVLGVELLGAHMAGDDSAGEFQSGGGVYVKPADLTSYHRVYAGRMSSSDWARWNSTEESQQVENEESAGWLSFFGG